MASKLGRLITGLTFRRAPRSRSMVQMADSLDTIARCLKLIVLKEYKIDVDMPVTRADAKREVFEPMYANNEQEAIREEQDRLRELEREYADNADERPERAGKTNLSMTMGAHSETDEMTPEEQTFLDSLSTENDER